MSKKREKLLQEASQQLADVFVGPLRQMHNEHKAKNFKKEFHFGHQRARLLFALEKNQDGVPVKELAMKLNVTPGAVTQLVDKLVEKKMVERMEDKKDRRVFNISLSRFAKNRIREIKTNYLKNISSGFNDFSDEELEQFINLLKKVITTHS
ncbi:MAG TPA: MarR family transcriptional regulator [Patescibacteria group bacterium]|nr:MarR family transcriptional regulator [Patescibacteria group bacterium]